MLRDNQTLTQWLYRNESEPLRNVSADSVNYLCCSAPQHNLAAAQGLYRNESEPLHNVLAHTKHCLY